MKTMTVQLLNVLASAFLFSCTSSPAFSQEPLYKQEESTQEPLAGRIRAVLIADTQIGFYDNNKSYTQDSLNLELTVRKINEIRPDFVVINGDMVNTSGSRKQLACFSEVIEKISSDIPVWYIPGNHDLGSGTKDEKIEAYIDRYGYDRFSFTVGDRMFIGINSSIIKDGRTEHEAEQMKWLKRALRNSLKKKAETYIFCHYPFFIKRYDEDVTYSNQSAEKRDEYWKLFKEFQVKAVFAGHLHDDYISAYDGIGMITVGPVSKGLGQGVPGMGICSFGDDGYDYSFIPLTDL